MLGKQRQVTLQFFSFRFFIVHFILQLVCAFSLIQQFFFVNFAMFQAEATSTPVAIRVTMETEQKQKRSDTALQSPLCMTLILWRKSNFSLRNISICWRMRRRLAEECDGESSRVHYPLRWVNIPCVDIASNGSIATNNIKWKVAFVQFYVFLSFFLFRLSCSFYLFFANFSLFPPTVSCYLTLYASFYINGLHMLSQVNIKLALDHSNVDEFW